MFVIFLWIVLGISAAAQESAKVWGGNHIELRVSASGADITFDCANGTITEPVNLEGGGTVRLRGTLTPMTHGPVRDDLDLTRKVIYVVEISEDAMTLRIEDREAKGPKQEFKLRRGRAGNVRRCG